MQNKTISFLFYVFLVLISELSFVCMMQPKVPPNTLVTPAPELMSSLFTV